MDFDEYIDRSEYPAMKWSKSFLTEHFGNAEAIPMSVADMDFKTPPAVIEQLEKRVAHGIYGYETKPQSYYKSIESWYQSRYGWKIEQQHIEPCPSVLNAISVLINQHSNEGDGIIIQPPVFFEFKMVIKSNNRNVVKNPLTLVNGHYKIDFDDLENKASNPRNKILILCNPHNPVGRVWSKKDLERIAVICSRHNIFVISDEIHGDFAFPPHRYIPYLSISEKKAQNTAACISPAKTFNISGMVDAMLIIPDERNQQQFKNFSHRYQTNKVNVFTSAVVEAAYLYGAEWLDELLTYIQGNVAFIKDYLQKNEIGISLIEPEGTFLAWLDFRNLGMDVKELEKFLAQEAQIAIAPGYWFGREGAGFARMTIGCPREIIHKAFNNLKVAVKAISQK